METKRRESREEKGRGGVVEREGDWEREIFDL